jgi:hypothetical protein
VSTSKEQEFPYLVFAAIMERGRWGWRNREFDLVVTVM